MLTANIDHFAARAQAGCTPAQHALTLLTVRCQADVDHLIPMTRSRTSRGRPGHR